MTAERPILAIEAGGTKTEAMLARPDGTVLARARGGPGNLQTRGVEGLFLVLRELLSDLADQVGREFLDRVETVSLGVAGADSDSDDSRVREAVLSAGVNATVIVASDARATLAGACGAEGVLVIAGTGSIAIGRNAEGQERRAGGWGHAFGDEGSGYDLGRQALNYTTRVLDGRAHRSLLAERVLESLGVGLGSGARAALLGLIGQVEAIARLAPVVLSAAEARDPFARGIVDAAARALAEMVSAVASPLGFGASRFPIALYGGLMSNGRFYTERFQEIVRLLWPRAEVRLAPQDAGLRGAFELALAAAGRKAGSRG
ncbi:MAG: hypothetical protein HYY25_16595 [Candidatus Wallbacteria bacterium]|nr:hypothetical protein [Candidatus Wallbacteria bacterium]